MYETFDFTQITEPLINWYDSNRRALPWRNTSDPYRIWISEIMLQQTRIEAVINYYDRFLKALPTIRDLAQVEEDALLKLWEGLGYYSRARNLKKAAVMMEETYGGRFPDTYEDILRLPGIGPYTAGAVGSFAFGLRRPAVDGNVLRVLSRVSGDDKNVMDAVTKKTAEQVLLDIMPKNKGDIKKFNQGLMELGQVLCLPSGQVLCADCPWKSFCTAYYEGKTDTLPIRQKKTGRRIQKRTVLVVADGERVLLNKRPDRGLLAGMYEFLNIEGHLTAKDALSYLEEKGLEPLRIEPLGEAKHLFSHVEWQMVGYRIRVASTESEEFFFAEIEKVKQNIPIPSAFRAYAQAVGLLEKNS